MQPERHSERDDLAGRQAVGPRPSAAARAAALFRLRQRSGAAPILPLPLTEVERGHHDAADFAHDASGAECYRGLGRAESLDYIQLQRTGLDNDDDAFLRLIQLGDRHASAMRTAQDR